MNDAEQPTATLPNEENLDLAEQKAASRRRDWADIAAGRRTPEEGQRDNTRPLWGDVDFTKIVILNENEANAKLCSGKRGKAPS